MSSYDHDSEHLNDHVSHEEDHEEHIDERWLVSYADMMTLLFGLFVLLYSMATMDQKEAEKVRQSTNEKFGESQEKLFEEKTIDYKEMYESLREQQKAVENDLKLYQDKIKEAEEVKKSLDIYSKTIEDLKKEKESIFSQSQEKDKLLLDLKSEIKNQKDIVNKKITASANIEDLTKKNQIYLEDLEKLKKQIKEKDELMSKIDVENQKLKKINQEKTSKDSFEEQKIAKLQEEVSRLQNAAKTHQRGVASEEQLLKQVRKLEERVLATEESKKEIEKRKHTNEEMLKQLEVKNQELAEQLRKIESEKSSGSAAKAFLAVFINWSTRDHDIDLVIQDPNGKKFDFKNRKHKNYPGHFALDTRRGPGAELWQSDKIIPGKYLATYSFYNQYGNTEDALVSGTIYTAKGSFEVKTVQMNLDKKREFHIQFEVAEDGDVKIINTRH